MKQTCSTTNSTEDNLYFRKFEDRKPDQPIPDSKGRTMLFQFFAMLLLLFGVYYLYWRWTESLNWNAAFFSFSLVIAETLSFISLCLIVINYWSNDDSPLKKPAHFLSDIKEISADDDRPLSIDVFITTVNESIDLVRFTIEDALKMKYPFEDVSVNIHLLDDGRRDGRDPLKENFKVLAEQYGINYLTRENNFGFKAGNLNNAIEKTNGDLILILDADTRPFEGFLNHTTGYFREKNLAWVQTPQWFYDLTESVPLSVFLRQQFKGLNKKRKTISDFLFNKIKTGHDIFGSNPKLFYDVILRRRNYHNASFCCGAASIHRRDFLFESAEIKYQEDIKQYIEEEKALRRDKSQEELKTEAQSKITKTVFEHHISEDIYTSLLLHSAPGRNWKSVLHIYVESKMLSPQDLESRVKQYARYAQGSIDIALGKHSPLVIKGLNLRQRLCYINTVYTYFSTLWITVFLLSPILFFFTLTPPVLAFNFDFFKHFIPFQVLNIILMAIANWGVNTHRAKQYYISNFWLYMQSIFKVLRQRNMEFNVTRKKQVNGEKQVIRHIIPHLTIVALTLLGILYNTYLIFKGVHPSYSGFTVNVIWGFINIYQLNAFIRAAFWKNTTPITPEEDFSELYPNQLTPAL